MNILTSMAMNVGGISHEKTAAYKKPIGKHKNPHETPLLHYVGAETTARNKVNIIVNAMFSL